MRDPSKEQNPVRLIETRGIMRGAYVCLSYCWGNVEKAQKGQTNKDNLARQLHSIVFKELPGTIIDAIHLCYKLGFRFLWVDRLCIVQDDMADWLMEASRMCDIYSRAALTIAVSLCDDSSQSFLSKRHMKPFHKECQSPVITYKNEETRSKGGLWITPRAWPGRGYGSWYLETPWRHFGSLMTSKTGGNRWLARGWTFQEWMLSPRVLHINTMTLWDCLNGYANELSHRHMDTPILSRDPTRLGRDVSWSSIMEEYSRRDITFERDRLPALAGLAACYRQVTGYTYLAGLWLEEMPKALLWQPYGRRFGHIRSDNILHGKQTIPSWSWASCDGQIEYEPELDGFSEQASIASFYCRYYPPDSISSVEEAWIDVEGRLSIVAEQDHDEPLSDEEDVDEEELPLFVKASNWWWASFPDQGNRYPDDAIAQANIYLLFLGFKVGYSDTTYRGLVLHECGFHDGRSCFRRLGTVELERCKFDQSTPPAVGPTWQQRLIRLV